MPAKLQNKNPTHSRFANLSFLIDLFQIPDDEASLDPFDRDKN